MTRHPLFEPLFLTGVLLGTFKCAQVFFPASWMGLLVPLLLLYAPFFLPSFRHRKISFLDRSWADFFRGIKWFTAVTLVIMPLFTLAAHVWMVTLFSHQEFRPAPWHVFAGGLFAQWIAVALPEEFFFRGFLQDRLGLFFKPRWNIFGVSLGWGWPLTALLFAFAHSVIAVQWWHFSIFFPALLFGWLREKTGSITAPVLFHAFCNSWTVWFTQSY